jgi:hypothetical protein
MTRCSRPRPSGWLLPCAWTAGLCVLISSFTGTAHAAGEGETCGRIGPWREACDDGLRCEVHRRTRWFAIGSCECVDPAACSPEGGTCEYEGGIYQAGESFPSIDGCNTCSCGEDGLVACTERACLCDAEDPDRSYVSTDREVCNATTFLCAPGWVPFFDSCGCGCEGGCRVGGCSGQLCVGPGDPDVSTCEWREQYACYAGATCELQADGTCGWTETDALAQCLEDARGGTATEPE